MKVGNMSELTDRRELHRKIFELTLALYRVTDFFPQGEALKRSLREKANEIFSDVTEYDYAGGRGQGALFLLAKVETMKGYLSVARSMKFVRQINLVILEREYEFLEHFLRGELEYMKDDSQMKMGNAPADSSHLLRDHDRNQGGYTDEEASVQALQKATAEPTALPKKNLPKTGIRTSVDNEAQMTDRQKKIFDYVGKASRAKISDLHALLAGVSIKTVQRDLHDLVQKNILRQSGQKRWTIYSLK